MPAEAHSPLAARSAAEIQFVWGDVVLASELVVGAASVLSLARRTSAATVPAELADVFVRCEPEGVIALGSATRGWLRTRSDWVALTAGEFGVRARAVARERIDASSLRPDSLTRCVLVVAALVLGGIGVLLDATTRMPNAAEGQRARTDALRALVARASSTGVTTATRHAPPVAPSLTLEAPAADIESARMVLGREDSVGQEAPPGARGVLSIAAFSAWASRFRWPDPVAGARALPAADAARMLPYTGLGAVGVGAGAGCSDPEHCRIVRAPELNFAASRAAGARIASAPMRTRSTALVVRAPDPPGGEITMEYVRRVVRHDLLANVVRCYDDRAAQLPLPGGRVLVRFTIRADGRVVDPSVISSAIADAPTHACIARVLRAYVFPASAAGGSVTYPFVFSSVAPETG